MTDSVFGNVDWVNDDNTLDLAPPTIQWHRGNLTDSNPSLRNGCWQLPVDSWEAVLGDSLPQVEVIHAGGVSVRSYLIDTISVAILSWKKRWFTPDQDGRPNYLGGYEDGAKSKLQYWVLVKELGAEAAILTVSGMNAKYLSEAVQAHVKKVIQPGSQLAKRSFGRHHFWLPLATLGKVGVKNNQYITPPGLALKDINQDVLKSLFTGQEVAEKAEVMIPQAKKWATFAFQPQTGRGEEVPDFGPPIDFDDSMAPSELVDEIPF